MNQEIEMFLCYYINYQQDNWTKWLSAVEFQYNNKKCAATGYTPFELNFGWHPWKGNLTVKMELLKLESFLQELQESWEAAKKSTEMAKDGKRSHKEVVWQEKKKPTRTKDWRQCVAES